MSEATGRTMGRNVMGRRSFLGAAVAVGAPGALPGSSASWVERERRASAFPQHDPERVAAVVGSSHGNLERVRALVLEQPALAKASWDWGFGDWETALGAASHTGRREIAELLIAHGARPTIFSAAMMGEVDTVRAYLTADPDLFLLHGPHGIPLVAHARAGGAEAEGVVDYLLAEFGPDERPLGAEGTDELQTRYGGHYRFDQESPPFEIVVAVRNGWLLVGAGEQPNSRVLQVDEDVYHPTGAPAVRLEFDVAEGRARALTIVDGPVRARGRRMA